MSTKRKIYSTKLKTKLVLEVIKAEKTLNEIASENNVTPKNLQNWKKVFLDNAEIAMEPAKAVKEYKNEIQILKDKNDKYAKVVGKMTVEQEWLSGKLNSLGLSDKKALIDPELKEISISKQCELIDLNRSSYYAESKENKKKIEICEEINNIYNETPTYGARKVHQVLLEQGYSVHLNTVFSYRAEMNLKPILAVKSVTTTIPAKEHFKYPYKLRDLDISKPNQVWSTDITYIYINGGFVYLAAIIDWYSKAILSWSISNTMDKELVTNVLNKALLKHGKPEIFNTDQGSQYTSEAHTKILLENNIIISMDGKGRATDNIVIERFWRSIKCELIYLNEYNSIKELRDDVKDYIDFYNYRRVHQSLNYKKPMNIYLDHSKLNSKINDNFTEKSA
jgi:putative transposase